MMFSFSGTVMTCTCSSTVTWLYLFLYCYLIYLTTPSAFLNGKVHDLDLVLAYVYQNVLLAFSFSAYVPVIELDINPCHQSLWPIYSFQTLPSLLMSFSSPPTPPLNLLFPTPLLQNIFTLTLFSLLCRTFPLSPWHHLYLQPLYPFQNPTISACVLSLPPSLNSPPSPFLPEPFFQNPFPLCLFPHSLAPSHPKVHPPLPLPSNLLTSPLYDRGV